MYYLVRGEVHIKKYMTDQREESVETRLVIADDETEAEKKFTAYFEKKDDPYYKSYYVYNVEVLDTIE